MDLRSIKVYFSLWETSDRGLTQRLRRIFTYVRGSIPPQLSYTYRVVFGVTLGGNSGSLLLSRRRKDCL